MGEARSWSRAEPHAGLDVGSAPWERLSARQQDEPPELEAAAAGGKPARLKRRWLRAVLASACAVGIAVAVAACSTKADKRQDAQTPVSATTTAVPGGREDGGMACPGRGVGGDPLPPPCASPAQPTQAPRPGISCIPTVPPSQSTTPRIRSHTWHAKAPAALPPASRTRLQSLRVDSAC
jgi:hypothetical protein